MMVACCVTVEDQISVHSSISPAESHFPVHTNMNAVNCTYMDDNLITELLNVGKDTQ